MGVGKACFYELNRFFDAFDAIEKKNPRVILLDPCWSDFDQAYAEELAQEEELIFICGHYEGYDERIKTMGDRWDSLGDYVLTGGELAAMTMIDATSAWFQRWSEKNPATRMIVSRLVS